MMPNQLGVRRGCLICSKSARRWSTAVFLLAEGALYLAFLFCDLWVPGADTAWLKYTGIALCLLMALLGACRGGDRLTALALALTLGADTFLLLLDRWYVGGMALFYAVQVVYLFRLVNAGQDRPMLLGRAALSAVLLLALLRLELFTPASAVGALYLSHFIFNLAQSLSLRGTGGKLFSWGLLLYFCCDLCVGIYNAPQLFPRPLFQFAQVGMWLFYLPGQVLITLSAQFPVQGEPCHDETK